MAPKALSERVSPLNAFALSAAGTHAQPREEVRALPRAGELGPGNSHSTAHFRSALRPRVDRRVAGDLRGCAPASRNPSDDDGALREPSDARQARLREHVLLRFLVGRLRDFRGMSYLSPAPLLLSLRRRERKQRMHTRSAAPVSEGGLRREQGGGISRWRETTADWSLGRGVAERPSRRRWARETEGAPGDTRSRRTLLSAPR